MKGHRWFIAIALVLLALIVTACGPAPTPTPLPAPTKAPPTAAPLPTAVPPTAPPPTAVPTATKAPLKGELSLLCTPQQVWCEGMKKEFEAKYPGVTVNFIRLSSGEALTRLRNEKANPQFDIWWGGPIDSFIAAKKEGLLEPYKSAAHANIIDPKLMLDDDPNPQWVGIYVGSLGFATNENYLKANPNFKAPSSLDDLIKPELKGQIVIAHPASSGTSYTFMCTALQLKGEKAGWEYMTKYAERLDLDQDGRCPGG